MWFFQRYPAPKTGSWPPSAIIQAMLELHRTNRSRTFLCFTKDPPPNKQIEVPRTQKLEWGAMWRCFEGCDLFRSTLMDFDRLIEKEHI